MRTYQNHRRLLEREHVRITDEDYMLCPQRRLLLTMCNCCCVSFAGSLHDVLHWRDFPKFSKARHSKRRLGFFSQESIVGNDFENGLTTEGDPFMEKNDAIASNAPKAAPDIILEGTDFSDSSSSKNGTKNNLEDTMAKSDEDLFEFMVRISNTPTEWETIRNVLRRIKEEDGKNRVDKRKWNFPDSPLERAIIQVENKPPLKTVSDAFLNDINETVGKTRNFDGNYFGKTTSAKTSTTFEHFQSKLHDEKDSETSFRKTNDFSDDYPGKNSSEKSLPIESKEEIVFEDPTEKNSTKLTELFAKSRISDLGKNSPKQLPSKTEYAAIPTSTNLRLMTEAISRWPEAFMRKSPTIVNITWDLDEGDDKSSSRNEGSAIRNEGQSSDKSDHHSTNNSEGQKNKKGQPNDLTVYEYNIRRHIIIKDKGQPNKGNENLPSEGNEGIPANGNEGIQSKDNEGHEIKNDGHMLDGVGHLDLENGNEGLRLDNVKRTEPIDNSSDSESPNVSWQAQWPSPHWIEREAERDRIIAERLNSGHYDDDNDDDDDNGDESGDGDMDELSGEWSHQQLTITKKSPSKSLYSVGIFRSLPEHVNVDDILRNGLTPESTSVIMSSTKNFAKNSFTSANKENSNLGSIQMMAPRGKYRYKTAYVPARQHELEKLPKNHSENFDFSENLAEKRSESNPRHYRIVREKENPNYLQSSKGYGFGLGR